MGNRPSSLVQAPENRVVETNSYARFSNPSSLDLMNRQEIQIVALADKVLNLL